MDQTTRGCKIGEHISECTTKKFQESIVEECGCSPKFSNFSNPEVTQWFLSRFYKINILVWK